MNQINSVCVYSASSTKIDAVYFQAAETLGRLFAEHHIRLINGAGSIGLMCSVADAVSKCLKKQSMKTLCDANTVIYGKWRRHRKKQFSCFMRLLYGIFPFVNLQRYDR